MGETDYWSMMNWNGLQLTYCDIYAHVKFELLKMNNFEVVQNLKMTFNKVDFILLLQ